MKTSTDCIPCFVRQAVEAVKMTASSDKDRKRLMGDVLEWLSDIDLDQSPPAAVQIIHRRLRGLLSTNDPYRAAKDRDNRLAKALIPSLRQQIEAAYDPFTMAVRFAITGNIIDMGAKNGIGFGDIYEELQSAAIQPIFGDMAAFRSDAAKAQTILYLADNAGEIFFDKLLIEQLSGARVTLAVRGGPVINDATRDDALAAGLEDIAEIIDNGSDAPGTLLDDCDQEFQRRFAEADVIIAKGQGNFETLSEVGRNIYFLHKTKCPIISAHSGFSVGSYVAVSSFQFGERAEKRGLQ